METQVGVQHQTAVEDGEQPAGQAFASQLGIKHRTLQGILFLSGGTLAQIKIPGKLSAQHQISQNTYRIDIRAGVSLFAKVGLGREEKHGMIPPLRGFGKLPFLAAFAKSQNKEVSRRINNYIFRVEI